MMLKKIAAATVLLGIAAAALYQFAGLRVALDGSGIWPRFVMRSPDYDALEASRAGQHQRPLPPPPDASRQSFEPEGRSAVVPGNAADNLTPPAAAAASLARGHVTRILARLPGTQPGRTLPRDRDPNRLAPRRAPAAVEAADRARLRVVCRRRGPCVHH
jgi:hypothetical protein